MRYGALLAALLLGLPAAAQDRPDAKEELASKLDAPFLQHAPWVLDYDTALRRARASGLLVFGYFTTAGP